MVNLLYSTNCLNITKAWSDPKEIDDRDKHLRKYQGWIILPAVLVALPLTLLYVVACIRAILAHRVSRKFHALIVNRAVGDLFACVVAVVGLIYVLLLADHISSHWIQLFDALFAACFWCGLVTYTSIGFLKLYGIARPLHYKEKVTMTRCIQMIKFSWLIFFAIVAFTMGFTLIVKIKVLADWTGCRVESCLTWMYKVRNVFNIMLYLVTVISSVISLILIRSAKKRSKLLHTGKAVKEQRSVRRRFRFPIIKLILGVLTFGIFHLPYAFFNIWLLFSNGCFFIQNFNFMHAILGIIRLFVLFRIILDDVLGFAMDKEIRAQLSGMFTRRRRRIADKEEITEQITMKFSLATNSGVMSESEPNKFETIEEANVKQRTESEKTPKVDGFDKMSAKKIKPKRHSEKTSDHSLSISRK